MNATLESLPRHLRGQAPLTFHPLAWLKLAYFCQNGNTEIAGFAITAKDNPLYIEEFVTVRQHNSSVTVSLDDQAVADYLDRCVDVGLPPQQVLRVWLHTHPGASAHPSGTDEDTFERVFGSCDWAIMFILSRTGETYARLSLRVGPGAVVLLPVAVNWAAWPTIVNDPVFSLAARFAEWQQEFTAHIQPIDAPPLFATLPFKPPTKNLDFEPPFPESWDWHDLDHAFLEDFERHEQLASDLRA
jgi:proteasome lid subunit RPN8/RPN11